MAVRILVADDHELVRSGLVSMLAGPEIEVVGQAANGEAAVDLAKQLRPDVVVLDIRMTDGDGLVALQRLQEEMPETRVVILSTYDNPTYVARAHTLGAADYVLKGADRDTILNAILAAARGEAPSPYGELHKIAETMAARKRQASAEISLTQRETQVLRHLALGLSNKEIGQSLNISVETVKEHVQHLLRKMNASDRTQAAVWAIKQGLIE